MAKQLGVSKGQFMKVSSRSMRPSRRGGRKKVTKRPDGGSKRGSSEDDGGEDEEYEMDETRSKHPKKHGKEHPQSQVDTSEDAPKEVKPTGLTREEEQSKSDDTAQRSSDGESTEKVEDDQKQQKKDGRDMTTSDNDDGVGEAIEKGSGEELAELEDVVVEEPAVQKLNLIGSHKRWNPKFTLRSHFDGIRCIRFDQEEPIVATGSEDGTVKLWNLRYLGKTGSKKSVGTGDIEPYFTLRGHTGGVMAMALSTWEQSHPRFLFSGGLDKSIRVWNFPPSDTDPLGSFGHAVNFLNRTLVGHTDVIWDLDAHPMNTWLLSAAADGSCRMWDVMATDPLKSSFFLQDGKEIPTSARFIPTDLRKILVSYVNGVVVCFDVSTGKKIWSCGEDISGPEKVENQINRIAVHPTLNLAVAVREDHRVDVIDIAEGKLVQSLVGHEGSVSSVAMNSSGTYFATSGHDESLRIWDVSTLRCIQEMSVHRPKFDECIHDVAFHPTSTMLGTCGADGTAKVYQ
jgi:striatin 1/3/4